MKNVLFCSFVLAFVDLKFEDQILLGKIIIHTAYSWSWGLISCFLAYLSYSYVLCSTLLSVTRGLGRGVDGSEATITPRGREFYRGC